VIRLALLATALVSGNLAAETLCSLGDLQRVISVEYESNEIAGAVPGTLQKGQ
jgi:hypothetical protein